jgi:hypothetical protein
MNPDFMFVFVLGLLVGMLALLETGRRLGLRRNASDAEETHAGISTVDGAVFGLMGLLIAFTFSGAASRFDTRRQLIVQEANAIGTAYLRLDLLPATTQPMLREQFRRYVKARLAVYKALRDIEAVKVEMARVTALQGAIWATAITATRETPTPQATLLLLPALNEMIDITTTRTVALQTHAPPIIFIMLAALALICSLLAGYGMAGSKTRSWIHMLGFAIVMAATIYVILDLEYPRFGLIRVDMFDQVLVDVLDGMK